MTDTHTLSGAYALDALSPEEVAEFRQHLSGCLACQQEVAELRDVTARMAAIEAIRPPAELKARVLAAVDRTPQLPPLSRPEAEVTPLHQGRRRWRLVLASGVAAAVAVIGTVVVVTQVTEDDTTLAAEVVEVFRSSDAVVETLPTSNGGEIRVAVDEDELAVDTTGLPALDAGRVYQLWVADAQSQVSSLGVVQDRARGAVAALPAEYEFLAVSVEPAGGSLQPTTTPIVQIDPSGF